MKVLRTPGHRFENLPDFPFAENFADADGLRMHYIDEGPPDSSVVLLLHGEPSWSYLYRHMIPPLTQAGYRVVAPDLIGFGKSDKPADGSAYTYGNHVVWMKAFLEAIDLHDITLFCQDWGSLIGLRVACENVHRFARIVLATGGLPTGDRKMPRIFRLWRAFARFSPWFPIGKLVNSGTVTELSPGVIAAYDAPFPTARYKAAARAFPRLVPAAPDDPAAPANRQAWEVLKRWRKPFLTAFSDRDPLTRGGERPFQKLVPGCQGQAHVTIRRAGHFLQEDKGPELSRLIIDFIEKK